MLIKKMITMLVLFELSHVATAATVTGTLPVATLVSANCTLNSAVLSFGNYAPIGLNKTSPLDSSTSFQIACTKGANVVISMNNGLYSTNAQSASRAMTDGSQHYLSYELYTNSGHSNVWNTTNTLSYMSTSSAASSETVYGRIPAGQNPAAGNYTDMVTITATF